MRKKALPSPFDVFRRVLVEDFEYRPGPAGTLEKVLCYVGRDLKSGKTTKVWGPGTEDPGPLGPDDLLIAYGAGAECKARQTLGWRPASNILCLHAEYCRLVAGRPEKIYKKRGLEDAVRVFGIRHRFETTKSLWQDRACDPRPLTDDEQSGMLEYCAADVDATAELFLAMASRWATEYEMRAALFRGHFVQVNDQIQQFGIPIDGETWNTISARRVELREWFIRDYGFQDLFDGDKLKKKKFEDFVRSFAGNRWPRTEVAGMMKSDGETLEAMAEIYPEAQRFLDVHNALSTLKSSRFEVDPDGRARCYVQPFGTLTGRNAPPSSRFIYSAAKWMRSIVVPAPGTALAYVDFTAQEFGIAAALSGDPQMWDAYQSGDVHMDFAIRAHLAPAGATKATHRDARGIAKAVNLGIMYGQGAKGISQKLKISEAKAGALKFAHQRSYPAFWSFIDRTLASADISGRILTPLAWGMELGPTTRKTTLFNFPMQGTGADLMRIVAIRLVERGIRLLATIHDAFLIEAPIAEIEAAVAVTRRVMRESSGELLKGRELESDVMIVRPPHRYIDEEGLEMWNKLRRALVELGEADPGLMLNE
jgi:DNA polymerase I